MKVSGEFPGSFNIYTSPVFFSVIEELFLTLGLVLVWMEYYKLFTNEFRNSVNECLQLMSIRALQEKYIQ